jgi:hypothetical protein
MNYKSYVRDVKDWLGHAANGLTPKETLQLFDRAFDTLIRKCGNSLEVAVLNAALSRAFHTSAQQYSALSLLRMGPGEIDFAELHRRIPDRQEKEAIEGLQMMMAEFLSIVDQLSGENRQPGACADLSKVLWSCSKTNLNKKSKGKNHDKPHA